MGVEPSRLALHFFSNSLHLGFCYFSRAKDCLRCCFFLPVPLHCVVIPLPDIFPTDLPFSIFGGFSRATNIGSCRSSCCLLEFAWFLAVYGACVYHFGYPSSGCEEK